MPQSLFTRPELERALEELIEELVELDEDVVIDIVGGAAISLAYDPSRPATRDVDSIRIKPEIDVLEVARLLGARNGWPEGWLNTKAVAFAPDRETAEVFVLYRKRARVEVNVASPETLLAMKMRSPRPRDADDLQALVTHCGITSIGEAQEIFDAHYIDHEPSERALARLRQIF